jgi:hypothetical protein
LKFWTVFGASASKSSIVIGPSLVVIVAVDMTATLANARRALVPRRQAASRRP